MKLRISLTHFHWHSNCLNTFLLKGGRALNPPTYECFRIAQKLGCTYSLSYFAKLALLFVEASFLEVKIMCISSVHATEM